MNDTTILKTSASYGETKLGGCTQHINKNFVELVTKERIMCAENEIIKSFG